MCSTAGSHPTYTAIVKMDPFTVLVNTTDQASVKVYHGGNYSCVATSKYGIDRKDFPVIGEETDVNLKHAISCISQIN